MKNQMISPHIKILIQEEMNRGNFMDELAIEEAIELLERQTLKGETP